MPHLWADLAVVDTLYSPQEYVLGCAAEMIFTVAVAQHSSFNDSSTSYSLLERNFAIRGGLGFVRDLVQRW